MTAETLIIDQYLPNKEGQVWYHLGNMYWIPEYKEFWNWTSTIQGMIHEDDFPHSYFRFINEESEKLFKEKWGEFVILDNRVDDFE